MAAVNPWAVVRDDDTVTIIFADLPAGVRGLYESHGDGSGTIVLATWLDQVDRNATLDHEHDHHRGGICGVPRFDERGVADRQALRLVPLDELAQLVASICDDGTPVMAWEIAEAFGVPAYVAERACDLLRRRQAT